jgi:hypothetical protein
MSSRNLSPGGRARIVRALKERWAKDPEGMRAKLRAGIERARSRTDKRHKLTPEIVREIRYVWSRWKAAGDRRGFKSLADIFEITAGCARSVVNRVTWDWVK